MEVIEVASTTLRVVVVRWWLLRRTQQNVSDSGAQQSECWVRKKSKRPLMKKEKNCRSCEGDSAVTFLTYMTKSMKIGRS